jgi:hypothetical protein
MVGAAEISVKSVKLHAFAAENSQKVQIIGKRFFSLKKRLTHTGSGCNIAPRCTSVTLSVISAAW